MTEVRLQRARSTWRTRCSGDPDFSMPPFNPSPTLLLRRCHSSPSARSVTNRRGCPIRHGQINCTGQPRAAPELATSKRIRQAVRLLSIAFRPKGSRKNSTRPVTRSWKRFNSCRCNTTSSFASVIRELDWLYDCAWKAPSAQSRICQHVGRVRSAISANIPGARTRVWPNETVGVCGLDKIA